MCRGFTLWYGIPQEIRLGMAYDAFLHLILLAGVVHFIATSLVVLVIGAIAAAQLAGDAWALDVEVLGVAAALEHQVGVDVYQLLE
jgi:hypothetical protein